MGSNVNQIEIELSPVQMVVRGLTPDQAAECMNAAVEAGADASGRGVQHNSDRPVEVLVTWTIDGGDLAERVRRFSHFVSELQG